jgi:hypothetical protein
MCKKIGIYPAQESDLEFYTQNLVIPISNRGEFDWEVNGKKVVINLKSLSFNYETSYKKVIGEFKNSSKIFNRHCESNQQTELIYQDLVIQAIQLAEDLKANAVVAVIFFTGASHHIDSLICELACRIVGIKQIFLYSVPMAMDRLLPLVQTNGVVTRSNLDKCISSEIFTKQIYDFSTITLSNSSNYLNSYSQSFYGSIWNLLVSALKKFLYGVLHSVVLKIKGKSLPSRILKPVTFNTDLILLLKQKKFIQVLRAYVSSDSVNVSNLSQTPSLVIFAHFEPESTNFPEGGELHNVIDLVIRIRSLGYTGNIIFKEHFALKYYMQYRHTLRSGVARSKSLYDNLKNLGCIFVGESYQPNDLSIVVTLVGTTALERSLSGKYTVVLGHIWYAGIPGSITLENAIDLLKTSSLAVNSNTIINNARDFLCGCLNHKTINNARGIGTGKPSRNMNDWFEFYQEMNNLLKELAE